MSITGARHSAAIGEAATGEAAAGEVALVAGLRTPITGRSRALASLEAHELAGHVLAGVARASARVPKAVVLGNCTGPGGNLGRVAALGARFGQSCVGWGVDAQCGSGLVAVMQAADHVRRTGEPAAAGGVESPSTAPRRLKDGTPIRQAPFAPPGFPDPDMTTAADDLAAVRGITRGRQEAFARRSHELALASGALLHAETLPLQDADDDGPRRLSAGALARFRPLLDAPTATVTPATAARIADGAAAIMLVPAKEAQGPHLVIRGQSLVGGDPALPGLAAAPAVHAVLAQAGAVVGDLTAVEVVEAYASQALATLDDLGLTGGTGEGDVEDDVDPRVNAAGGALALGHPWGASGAVALVRLLHRLMESPPGALGVATCAVAGGMGAAVLVERR
ncbi:acetyl-CoA C-acyltransferase [Nesterenkonia sp. HG001]|uniref:thiolase family protein n=1 Tax=Nesterenkonia sp. HG001 TaxID=2983207 RepID=UPI002AC3C85A|nr:acetyl-CoA C-acyltransferase [Nesterenkonia sp. HG001]MDZ5077709.1 acetyl-CoA C-acyltransferase [Nesterenkonia sp. HG001]